MRLRLVPKDTKWDFFGKAKISLGIFIVLMVLALGSFFSQGLNFGIDFRGGTTIRTRKRHPGETWAPIVRPWRRLAWEAT